jgi:hypothetical protein
MWGLDMLIKYIYNRIFNMPFRCFQYIYISFLYSDNLFIVSAETSGTTVTFVIIDEWVVTVASVGDSRCILESADGSVYYLSADHRFDSNPEKYVLLSRSIYL